MADLIIIRRDTTTLWDTINPILSLGEIVVDTSTNEVFYGDGETAWNTLKNTPESGVKLADVLKLQSKFSTADKSSLSIDLSEADYFYVTLTANASFDLTNLTSGVWVFNVKNNSGSAIDIAIPNTANDMSDATTVNIAAGKFKEISLTSNGTKRVWLSSTEITVGS